MDNVFKYFNGFFKGLTGLVLTVLGLGVAVQLLYPNGMFGMDVIGEVTDTITKFGEGGFAGLVALCVLFGLLSNNK